MPSDVKLDEAFFRRNGQELEDGPLGRLAGIAREIEAKVEKGTGLHKARADGVLCVEPVPDVPPVIGYLDLAALLAPILRLVKSELREYAIWIRQ